MTAKLLVATSFPVWPPRGGGQTRVFGLYAALARRGVAVDIVCLAPRGDRAATRTIAPGVRELRVPASAAHHAAEFRLHARAGVPVTDIALALHWDLTPAYGEALAAAAADAAAVVASHPFAEPTLAAACGGLPLIYEAHNVEIDLKTAMLEGVDGGAELAAVVHEVEAACCARAAHTIVCSDEDRERLGELFGLPAERAVVVPNGVDPSAFAFTDAGTRAERRERLGLDSPLALFLGSWHEPNLAAVRDVIAAAEALPATRFLVLGSAGLAFAEEPVPRNVDLCGVVDSGFVRSALGLADAALNPMRWGSGTNMKMLDYALAGAPIVSSTFGTRGLGFEPGRHFEPMEPGGLAAALESLAAHRPEVVAERTLAAAEYVRDRFTWDAIAARWHEHPAMRELLEGVEVA